MTTRQSSTASQSVMDWDALPFHPTDSDHELRVRIACGPAKDGALERDGDGAWVGRLRRISVARLRQWGMAELIDDAALLLSELLTNALRYGGDAEIAVSLVATSTALMISVNDGSPIPPQLTEAGVESESGRGLHLIAAFAKNWGVSSNGTTTWCTLSLPEVDS
jgi:anti-sigma regulatory factor (Ser/Thr protein kinase)